MTALPARALVTSTHEDQLESEQAKDIWAMSLFGHSGRLDFTAISQPWLREGAKRWAIHDLIRRRGEGVTTVLRAHVAALAVSQRACAPIEATEAWSSASSADVTSSCFCSDSPT